MGCNIYIVSWYDVYWLTSARTCRWCDVEGGVREAGYIQHQHGKNTVVRWEEVHSVVGASALTVLPYLSCMGSSYPFVLHNTAVVLK